jgi:hypothetical protein
MPNVADVKKVYARPSRADLKGLKITPNFSFAKLTRMRERERERERERGGMGKVKKVFLPTNKISLSLCL